MGSNCSSFPFNKFSRRRSVRVSCVNSNENVDRMCDWRYDSPEMKSAKNGMNTSKWSGNGTTIVGALIPFYELAIACRKSLWCSQPARGFEDIQTLTTLAPSPITLFIAQCVFFSCLRPDTCICFCAGLVFFTIAWLTSTVHNAFITHIGSDMNGITYVLYILGVRTMCIYRLKFRNTIETRTKCTADRLTRRSCAPHVRIRVGSELTRDADRKRELGEWVL